MTVEDINELIICAKNNDEAGALELLKKLKIEFTDPEEGLFTMFDQMSESIELITYFKDKMKSDAEIAGLGAEYIRNPEVARSLFEQKDEYAISSRELALIISRTQDDEIIKKAIDSKDEYDFSEYDLTKVITACKSKEFVLPSISSFF